MFRLRLLRRRRALICALALAASTSTALAEGVVNIYSYRQPELLKPLTDAFTKETGIRTQVLFSEKGLADRIAAEGPNSPADVLLTVDISRLAGAKEKGITQPIESAQVTQSVPENLRDPEGHWVGLTTRARIVYASKDRFDGDDITYDDLADPKYRGRVCTRSGGHVYSLGLISWKLAREGEDETRQWLEGVRDNLARKPAGNDRAQVKAIHAGECDLAIGNTYYMGKMLTNEKEPEQKDWARSVKVLFPSDGEAGTHVNISGVALAKHAPNEAEALRFIDFLTSDMAQKVYAEANFEYPVKPGVPTSDLVRSWGVPKPDATSLDAVARNRKRASELVDETGFDQGPQS